MELKRDPKDSTVKSPAAESNAASSAAREELLKKRRARDLVEEVKSEFKNITWTSKEELQAYTKIVIGSTFMFGLSVYFVDLAIQMVLNFLTWITRLTVG